MKIRWESNSGTSDHDMNPKFHGKKGTATITSIMTSSSTGLARPRRGANSSLRAPKSRRTPTILEPSPASGWWPGTPSRMVLSRLPGHQYEVEKKNVKNSHGYGMIWRSLKNSSHFTPCTTWRPICRLLSYLFSAKKGELKLGDPGTALCPKEGGVKQDGVSASKHTMNKKIVRRSKQCLHILQRDGFRFSFIRPPYFRILVSKYLAGVAERKSSSFFGKAPGIHFHKPLTNPVPPVHVSYNPRVPIPRSYLVGGLSPSEK